MSELRSFPSEQELISVALRSELLRQFEIYENSANALFIEPKGLFGVPDLLLANVKRRVDTSEKPRIFAFEFKLRNWRRALIQAYRYRSFAHRTYVVLDARHITPALSHLALFRKANVGLISISNAAEVKVYFQPNYNRPYSRRLLDAVCCGIRDALSLSPIEWRQDSKYKIDGYRFVKKKAA